MRRIARCLTSVLVVGVTILGPGGEIVAAQPPAGSEVPHASARIGDDDPLELAALRLEHNLQLVFAERGGAYLADVSVRIRGAAGETVLAAYSPGPLFFATLPTGQYRIEAEYRGMTLEKPVRVTEGLRQDLHFYWPHE